MWNVGWIVDGASPTWDIGPLPRVMMDIQNTIHYPLNESDADSQWNSMIPSNGGIIHLGPNREPFMLSMFHQLRCLDIIRRAYIEGRETKTSASHHCLNYIRQMVLCRGDLRLERVVDPYGEHAVQFRDAYTCLDWTVVYTMVQKHEQSLHDFQLPYA